VRTKTIGRKVETWLIVLIADNICGLTIGKGRVEEVFRRKGKKREKK
jgi:hypothetical protein